VALATIGCAAKSLRQLAKCNIESGEFIARMSLGSNYMTRLNYGEFNLVFWAGVSAVIVPGHFYIQRLNLMAKLLYFMSPVRNVFSESVRDGEVAGGDVNFHDDLISTSDSARE
jgi:hypothetical protein